MAATGKFVLRSETTVQNPYAARLYGKGVTQGRTVFYINNAVGTRTSFLAILCQGARDRGDLDVFGPLRVYYSGFELPEFDTGGARNWKYHSGKISSAPDYQPIVSRDTTTTLEITGHGKTSGDLIAFWARGLDALLPAPILLNTQYMVNVVDANHINVLAQVTGTPNLANLITFTNVGTNSNRWFMYSGDRLFFDATQGRPTFFPSLDFTFAGLAYIEILLPTNLSTATNEPTNLKVIMSGKRIRNIVIATGVLAFDSNDANITEKPNNALVSVDALYHDGKLPMTRFEPNSFIAWRDECSNTIPWVGGADVPAQLASWNLITNLTYDAAIGKLTKTVTTNAWDSAAFTDIITSDTASIECLYNGGELFLAFCGNSSVDLDNKQGLVVNNFQTLMYLWNHQYYPINQMAVGDRLKLVYNNNGLFIYHNGVEMPMVDSSYTQQYLSFRIGIGMWRDSGSAEQILVAPSGNLAVPRQIPRFQGGFVAATPQPVVDLFESEIALSAASWADVDEQIQIATKPDRTPCFTFVYDPAHPEIPSNVTKVQVKQKTKPLTNFWTFLYRDDDDPVLSQKFTTVDRPNVRARSNNRLKTDGVTQYGVMPQSQMERIGQSRARIETDLPFGFTVEAFMDSITVCKGSYVYLVAPEAGYNFENPALCIVIEEKLSIKDVETRVYELQIITPDWYRDDDHGEITPGFNTQTTSNFVPPPFLTALTLTQGAITLPNGTLVTSVEGLATFAVAPRQRGRVFTRTCINQLTLILGNSGGTFTKDIGQSFPSGSTPIYLFSASDIMPTSGWRDTPYYLITISGSTCQLSESIGGTPVTIVGGEDLIFYGDAPWVDTGIDLVPTVTNQAGFSIQPVLNPSVVSVRVQTFSSSDASLAFSNHFTRHIVLGGVGRIVGGGAGRTLGAVYYLADFPNIRDAKTQIGNTVCVLRVTSPQSPVALTEVLPSTLNIEFVPAGSASFRVAAGVTLTINSMVDPGAVKCIELADSTAHVLFGKPVGLLNSAWLSGNAGIGGSADAVLAELFLSGTANGSSAFFFPSGTWTFNAAHSLPAQCDIYGAGKWQTTFQNLQPNAELFTMGGACRWVSFNNSRILGTIGEDLTNAAVRSDLPLGSSNGYLQFNAVVFQTNHYAFQIDSNNLGGQTANVTFDKDCSLINNDVAFICDTPNTNIVCDAFIISSWINASGGNPAYPQWIGKFAKSGPLRFTGELAGNSASYGTNGYGSPQRQEITITATDVVTTSGLAIVTLQAATLFGNDGFAGSPAPGLGKPHRIVLPLTTADNTASKIAQTFRRLLSRDPAIQQAFHVTKTYTGDGSLDTRINLINLDCGQRQIVSTTLGGTLTTGNIVWTIIKSGMTTQTVTVAVLATDTLTQAAVKCAAALNANTVIKAIMHAENSYSTIMMRVRDAAVNDATLNLAYTGAGTTADAVSALVVPGYAANDTTFDWSFDKNDVVGLTNKTVSVRRNGLQHQQPMGFEFSGSHYGMDFATTDEGFDTLIVNNCDETESQIVFDKATIQAPIRLRKKATVSITDSNIANKVVRDGGTNAGGDPAYYGGSDLHVTGHAIPLISNFWTVADNANVLTSRYGSLEVITGRRAHNFAGIAEDNVNQSVIAWETDTERRRLVSNYSLQISQTITGIAGWDIWQAGIMAMSSKGYYDMTVGGNFPFIVGTSDSAGNFRYGYGMRRDQSGPLQIEGSQTGYSAIHLLNGYFHGYGFIPESITVAAITADMANWNPGFKFDFGIIRVGVTGANRTIHGLIAPFVANAATMIDGYSGLLVNTSDTYALMIPHESVTATDVNRWHNINGTPLIIAPGASRHIYYDLTLQRWRLEAIAVTDVPYLDTSKITSGTFFKSIVNATGTWSPAEIPNLDAAKIATGVLATARLGSGTASSSTYLRGDGTWAAITAGGGTGTVTGVSSVTGDATIATATTTPAITIVSAPKWTVARTLAGNSVDGSTNVAFANKFIVQGTADAGLSGAQFLGALGTGILKNTTATGIFSIATAADFPTLNQNTTGSAGTAGSATVANSATSGFPVTGGDLTLLGDGLEFRIGTGGNYFRLYRDTSVGPLHFDGLQVGARGYSFDHAEQFLIANLSHARFKVASVNVNTLAGCEFSAMNTVPYVWYLHNRGGVDTPVNRFSFYDDPGNECFTILPGGSIGIRNSNPLARFDVVEPILGNAVYRLSSLSSNDDPAEIVYQNRVATTDATVTTLHTFTVPVSTTYLVEIVVIARRTAGTAGTAEDGAAYKISATYKNVAGIATLIGTVNSLYVNESQAAWDVTLILTGTNALVACKVAGALNNNVVWHMTARMYQVSI